MQRLIIDIGNTLVKIAVFDDDYTTTIEQLPVLTIESLQKMLIQYPDIKSAIISSVRFYPVEIDHWLEEHFLHISLNPSTPLPFINKYATPETLGKDRVAGAAAAIKIFPHSNVLVIDAGTSITYDLITANKNYLGGGISPGIQMRFKALHTFTDKLPLIENIEETSLIGINTKTSLLSGVLNGVLAEVDGIIDRYLQQHNPLKIIISGGDYKYFDKKLKNSIFATPNIVMQGLIEILKFNED
ncbi:MAG: pantothenate kinase [Bacteroidetes bacterium]|nr:MAG: pantothenate kinase [Bacteroidota bacterium]